MGTPTIKASGNISIVWGTTNGINVPAGALIETLRVTPKNGAPIDIEGNAGFSAVLVGLRDGFDATATIVYDANVSLPQEGANVVVVCPKQDGNAGTTNYNCHFWSWSWNRAKKDPARVDLQLTNRPDINT